MNPLIEKLNAIGQSLWYDNIERRLLESGEIAGMIAAGIIRGMTSNPSIFNNAIGKSSDYDISLIPMAWAGCSPEQIYEALVIDDIRMAADLFLPLCEESGRIDGYVSLEVNPTLAYDTDATLAEARRLWRVVARPNLMIKIPATLQGLLAIRRAIAEGININVTLIFSLERYQQVMEAYLLGLEDRLVAGQAIDEVASVASFFVSRIDTKVDKRLDALGGKQAAALRGKLALASAKLAYQEYRRVFESERFERLKAVGAHVQRPLWASTSTKDPTYPDTLYVDNLIGPDTVNTVPPVALQAFLDHGLVHPTLEEGIEEASQAFAAVEALGISMEQVTRELEDEGVKVFCDSFETLLNTIETRRVQALRQLGPLAPQVAARVASSSSFEKSLPSRLYALDATLWSSDAKVQAEIVNRLGWLWLPFSEESYEAYTVATNLRRELCRRGYTHVILLGMGGSSLAPEVLSMVFGERATDEGLKLSILDSTAPLQVKMTADLAPLEKCLYIVASKSGGTAEVAAFFDFFWDRAVKAVGERAGEHFIAITDADTALHQLAKERKFRQVFLSDPAVGGRYSALSPFGLVPAALMGLDGKRLLERGAWMAKQCIPDAEPDSQQAIFEANNPGYLLGVVLGEAALQGRNKLTFIADPGLGAFGAWLEQLIAESSGKEGKGILPVDGEPLMPVNHYRSDRIFVYLRRQGQWDAEIAQLGEVGQPALVFNIAENYDLGAEFYRWEVATAVACAILGVNPFDQPDVQDSKDRTKEKIVAYRQRGQLEVSEPFWSEDGVSIYLSDAVKTRFRPIGRMNLTEILSVFLAMGKPDDYVALNAYLARDPETTRQLERLRVALARWTRLATTLGFGPRFLHSTGQLHKGGANKGLFLQITSEHELDLEIPGQGLTFGTLLTAQALGDFEALQMRQRRLLSIHLRTPSDLERLINALE